VSGTWCLGGGVGVSWCWFALLLSLPSSNSVIQLLEDSDKFLELLRDIVREGECMLVVNTKTVQVAPPSSK
jgi:hypothetical protein